MYLFDSYLARRFPHEFSVYNVTAGLIANIPALCSSGPTEEKGWLAGTALISLYDLNVDVDSVDRDNLFVNNFLLWNLLHLANEHGYLFASPDSNHMNFQINTTQLGTMVKLSIRFF